MEKLKKLFEGNGKNKKIENLVAFLVILVITLIIINSIIKDDGKKDKTDYTNVELAKGVEYNFTDSNNLEKRLEEILSKLDGVKDVSVLITYSESSTIVPMYNENKKTSTTEETDQTGGKRTIQSEDNEKNVVTGSDSNPITQKNITPKIEGAIIAAQGASNANVKANIISAVEAVTGLATHKIQVFEMGI